VSRRVLVIFLSAGVASGLALAVDTPSRDSRYPDTDIFVVNAEGTARRNLTRDGSRRDDTPALSPDGRTLAFNRVHGEGNDASASIATMPSGGGKVRDLFVGRGSASSYPPGSFGSFPAWSHDGQLIAFNSCCRDQAVGVVRTDGSGLTWIPNAADPTWLGSRRLAFLMDFSDAGALAIAEAKADGTERRVVVRGTDVGLMLIGNRPFASPNGRTIAFSAIDGRQNFIRVYSSNIAAGSHPRLIAYESGEPSWSPTGRRLVFVNSAGVESAGLWTIRADGKRRRHFPATRRLNLLYPSWSPDGTRIAFIASRSFENNRLVVMNVRHRSLRVVARRVERRWPVWSRNSRRLYYVAPSGS
jgi:dipeptidyl aminopeptidase/acylaminoacyl peptidase